MVTGGHEKLGGGVRSYAKASKEPGDRRKDQGAGDPGDCAERDRSLCMPGTMVTSVVLWIVWACEMLVSGVLVPCPDDDGAGSTGEGVFSASRVRAGLRPHSPAGQGPRHHLAPAAAGKPTTAPLLGAPAGDHARRSRRAANGGKRPG